MEMTGDIDYEFEEEMMVYCIYAGFILYSLCSYF